MKRYWIYIAVVLSVALFITSFNKTAFCTSSNCRSGSDALISGAFGFLTGGAAATWIANPMLLCCWVFAVKRPKLSLILSIVAVLVAGSFLLFSGVIENEAGQTNRIIQYGAGYRLWLLSISVMAIGNVISYYSKRATKTQ